MNTVGGLHDSASGKIARIAPFYNRTGMLTFIAAITSDRQPTTVG